MTEVSVVSIVDSLSSGSISVRAGNIRDEWNGALTGKLTKLDCLGVLSGSNCPHYDGEPERRPAYQHLIAEGMKPGIACDDGVRRTYLGY